MSEEIIIHDTDLLVSCRVCGKRMKAMSIHLKSHDLSSEEYLEMYPDSPLNSKALLLQRSLSARGPRKKKITTEVKSKESIIFEKVEDIISDNSLDEIKNTNLSGTIHLPSMRAKKIIINTTKDYTPQMLRNKNVLLEFFSKKYKTIVNNHLIEHFYLNGFLEYSFITDFVDLDKKIIFDFPNAFWHNQDVKFIYDKDDILIKDGWKIIRFMSFEEVLA